MEEERRFSWRFSLLGMELEVVRVGKPLVGGPMLILRIF